MLTILGRPDKRAGFCDRFSRRGFLQIGGAAMGGLALNQILAMEARAGIAHSHKAIINIYLPGGPPHIDMWDLKPEAPAEIRGEFKPIKTNVPGIEICELFPKIAAMMDKFAIIRTLADSDGLHDAYQCMTGHKKAERGPSGGWPSAGAWISRLGGPADPAVPANMAVMYETGNRTWGEPSMANFLGTKHNPFNVVGRKARERSDNMVLRGITLERLARSRAASQSLRSLPPRHRRLDEDGGLRHQHDAGSRDPHRFQAWRRARSLEGRPADCRAVRQERRAIPARRRPANGREFLRR